MLRNTIWRSTIYLFLLAMMVFFIVQFFFKDQNYFQISDFQYILTTGVSNSFVITTLFAIVAAYNMLKWDGNKSSSFWNIFKLSFIPGVLAGFFTLISVFAWYEYVDPAGIEQLKTEYLDYSLLQAKDNEAYEEVEKVVNSKEVRGTNLLSFRTFTLILGIVIFFNLSLALMVTFLWKIRNSPRR
ncbi:MAG: DUF4199 domain-containing protein [Flavobacteriaceae bacterium]|nr:DUF4199 domain-containing protein [Flavobacteriaceae bacterium]